MFNRFFNALGFFISILIVIAIIYWGVNLSNLTVEKLPVIKALDGEIRKKPPNETEHNPRKLEVNNIISEDRLPLSEEKINLAPKVGPLSEVEAELTILPDTGSLDLSEAIQDALRQLLNDEKSGDVAFDKALDFKLVFTEAENQKIVEDFYLQLVMNFEDRLVDIPYSIENIKIDGKNFYRLILTGFKDKSGVKELQLFLSENGIGSEVSTK